MATRADELLAFLNDYLVKERAEQGNGIPVQECAKGAHGAWQLFRALVNTRKPVAAAPEFYAAQDELLSGMIENAGIATADDATPSTLDSRLLLWRGDIVQLSVDAIVNAANSRLTGCWQPNHLCVDNAIHTFAGVQLREECTRLMATRDNAPQTPGQAVVTGAYNLPSRLVIHTVGPIANGTPKSGQDEQLASCYESCLEAAARHGCSTLAFTGISAGVFGYPEKEAARIAISTVRTWLDAHPDANLTVVFDVFFEETESIYKSLLSIEER